MHTMKRTALITAAIVIVIFLASGTRCAAQVTPIKNPKLTGTTNVEGNFNFNPTGFNEFKVKNNGGADTAIYVSPGGDLTIGNDSPTGNAALRGFSGELVLNGQATLDWANRWLVNSGGNNAVNWELNRLGNSVGATVLDWEIMSLIDGAGTTTVSWNACRAWRNDGTLMIDWGNGSLYGGDGNESINFGSRIAYDNGLNITVDWQNRQLRTGATVNLDWDAGVIYDNTGVASVLQNARVLSTATATSIDWNARDLVDASNVASGNYGTRQLFNALGTTVLNWNDTSRGSGNGGVSIPELVVPYRNKSTRNIGLTGFSQLRAITSLVGVSSGISGVTYNPRTNTLFLVRNVSGAAGNIYEVTLDGTLVRTITNSNFIDTEAINWVGCFNNNTGTTYDILIVAEEDHTTAANESSLTLCLLASGATTLDRTATNGSDPDNVTVTTAYSGGTIANGGIEGVAYDPFRGKVYYTAEFRTQAGSNTTPYTSGPGQQFIFQRSVTATPTSLAFGAESTLCNILPLSTTVATGTLYNSGTPGTPYDIGDMCFDQAADAIILQSDTGDRAIRISLAGAQLDWLVTTGNQPEGVTMHPDGDLLWMVGEAQEFFVYGFRNNLHQFTSILTQTQTLDFASTLATAVSDLTITVTGAAPGDVVMVSPPAASVTATATFTAWVSATNTVTVRFSPKATEDPASGVYRVTVIKQ